MDLFWPVFDSAAVIVLIAALWWLRDNVTHNERQILIALFGIGIAIFLAEYPSGVWRAFGVTFLWEFGIVGGFFALIFSISGIGNLFQILAIASSPLSAEAALEKGKKAEENWSGHRTALRWYRKAAGMGNLDAQTRLGLLYLGGKGIRKDLTKAKSWFQKAADQGYAEAGELLKKLEAGEKT